MPGMGINFGVTTIHGNFILNQSSDLSAANLQRKDELERLQDYNDQNQTVYFSPPMFNSKKRKKAGKTKKRFSGSSAGSVAYNVGIENAPQGFEIEARSQSKASHSSGTSYSRGSRSKDDASSSSRNPSKEENSGLTQNTGSSPITPEISSASPASP